MLHNALLLILFSFYLIVCCYERESYTTDQADLKFSVLQKGFELLHIRQPCLYFVYTFNIFMRTIAYLMKEGI